MTLLPFERAFRSWLAERKMGWESLELGHGGIDGRTTAHHLQPAAPPRATLLALHGAGNDALFAWVGLFKRLLLRHFEIFTFDLPGHGRANRSTLSLESLRGMIEQAVSEASASASGRPLHALGVSLGGSALLDSLPRVQPHLSSAAAVVPPLRIRFGLGTLRPELGARNVKTLWRQRRHYGLTGLLPSFGRFKREAYPLRFAEAPPPGMFGYVQALNRMLAEMALLESCARVSLPVLLVYGDRDAVVPAEQGERLAAALPRGELVRIPGGTHLSTLLEPQTVERLIDWLEAHS